MSVPLPLRMDYFKKLQELINTEREVDKQAYLELTRSSTVAERRAAGLAWYPIAIRGTELSKAEYITVEVERPTHTDVPHQLRFGVSAMLFSNLDPKNHFLEGTITFVGGSRLKISLRTDELPDWASDGKLGIDLLFDDNSYDEMQAALKLATSLAEKKEEGHLIRVLTGATGPTFHTDMPVPVQPRLNSKQQEAVQKIVQASELAIVHGPPGTGKTTTLVQAILALIKGGEKRILVTAPSNTAVDLLSEQLSEQGLNVLRVGNPARVSERLMSLTLDSRISSHSSVKEIKRLKKQASEFKDMAHKYKRSFGRAEREQRKALFDEAYKIMKDVSRMEQYIIDDVTARAQVITATLVGANHYTVRDLRYNTVVIDEAGQALEPACWIPILKGKKVILAGDHCQLSPTIKSDAAAKAGLAHTLLSKCIALYPQAVVMLQEQYRMHEVIMGFSSKIFYNNQLTAHSSVAHRLLQGHDLALTFIDTAGCGFDERAEQKSISNPEEAALLFRHLVRLVAELALHYSKDTFPTIAVISPYKEQLSVLKEQLLHTPELQPYAHAIAINTIDSFQGQERDIVYLSMTRSNTDGDIGFLADTRRMNVAMTRARKKLIVIGDSATLSQHPFYADMVAYAETHNAYKSAWEENWSM
jgi:ATP-dependent RNA/DNA helicase IGHMBP2